MRSQLLELIGIALCVWAGILFPALGLMVAGAVLIAVAQREGRS